MTKETTFKEFVEEKGIRFARLVYGSEEYIDLARQFNEAKLQIAEEDRPVREIPGQEVVPSDTGEG